MKHADWIEDLEVLAKKHELLLSSPLIDLIEEVDSENKKLIDRMRDAIDNMFFAVEEGDVETISHLALRYKRLFGTDKTSADDEE